MSAEMADPVEAGRELARSAPSQREAVESDEAPREEPRVFFRATGEGYAYVAASRPQDGRERPVYLHRLAAVAWGVLDGLDDPRHVHHCEWSIPWLNVEENLEAETPDEHALYHLAGCEP